MPQQKPKSKQVPYQDELMELVHGASNWVMGKLSYFTGNLDKFKDIAGNNFELGKMHFQLGNVGDAIFRFRMVTWVDPKHADAWFFLGASYMADRKIGMARKALQKSLDLKPDYDEARYMLAIAKGKEARASELPKKMPLSLAVSHFDSVAEDYTREQIEDLRYEGHNQIFAAMQKFLTEDRVDYEMVELGVGSGLCGPLVRPVAARLTGVDISQPMLEEAMKLHDGARKVYDVLLHKEMHEFLKESAPEMADILFSATALSYIGDLGELFPLASRLVRPGGMFAFTVDPMVGADFQLDTIVGRYRYSEKYLQRMAQENQFAVVHLEEEMAYPAYPMWVCVLGKQS
jgi:predicted TPR repeat methyltransferase